VKRFTQVFGALCFAKLIELLPRLGWQATDNVAVLLMGAFIAAWLLATIRLMRGRGKPVDAGVLSVSILVVYLWRPALANHHLALIAWIAAILWLFPNDVERRLLLRVQCTVVYAFAALAKLNPEFLSGDVLGRTASVRIAGQSLALEAHLGSVLIFAAVVTIVTEAWLAMGLWIRRMRWPTVLLGVAFHTSVVLLMVRGPGSAIRLTVFNALMVLLYTTFFTKAATAPVAEPSAEFEAIPGS
jgi:hypothetical protein